MKKSSNMFVHLHVHTVYSILDGLCKIPQLIKRVSESGMDSIAITDHGVICGAIDFYQEAISKGIRPIIGCEFYVTPDGINEKGTKRARENVYHLILLAENNKGYSNLIKLITKSHLEGFYYKPRIDKEILANHREGIIGLSACLKGEISSYLLMDDYKKALDIAGEYRDILGKENFYIELQDHGLEEEKKILPQLIKIAKSIDIEVVGTNDVHYLEHSDAEAHDILLCIQTQTTVDDPNRMKFKSNEFYLKDAEEMEAIFEEIPQAIYNTHLIAERCCVEIEFKKMHYPVYHLPPDKDSASFLRELAENGLKEKYGIENIDHPKDEREKAIVDRVKYELNIIQKTGYVNYYLVVWDFVRFAKSRSIPVGPGRGSGGSSVIAYLIGITDIDPIEYNLIFERFLNPERVSPPDFDIDFCQNRREEVINYVREKYGKDHVAQIMTVNKLQARSVIRDIGRALGIPYEICDKWSKMVPSKVEETEEDENEDKGYLDRILTKPDEPLTIEYNKDPVFKKVIDYGRKLEGSLRSIGRHAAGVVIANRPLSEIIPLHLDRDSKEIVTHYPMKPLGELGLLKMDFLGLRTLTVMDETLSLVKHAKGIEVDLKKIPYNDKKTYELLSNGNTVGVFQLESEGMQALLQKCSVNNMKDLIALIALYRPGPMNWLEEFIKRKHGISKITYLHNSLKHILEETYGIIVYQEQVQQAANILAGFTLGEADILRKAMGKKDPRLFMEQREKFISSCQKYSGIPKNKAEEIFDTIIEFAKYGFCKAHSTGYAIVAYQTAYLKANFPAEFMSALISSEIGNFDKLKVFLKEARNIGLDILPPDINKSNVRFMPEQNNAIRYGLAGIKNVGEVAAKSIVEERETNGPFKGLIDFCARIDSTKVNKKVIEALILAGSFDSIDPNRSKLYQNIDLAMKRGDEISRLKRSGQVTFFEFIDKKEESRSIDSLPEYPRWHRSKELSHEISLLGIYTSGHPLEGYESIIKRYETPDIVKILKMRKPISNVTIGGVVSDLEIRQTKKRQKQATAILEGIDNAIDIIILPEALERVEHLLKDTQPIFVTGNIVFTDEEPKMFVKDIIKLDDAPAKFISSIIIKIPAKNLIREHIDKIKELIEKHPGNVEVKIVIADTNSSKRKIVIKPSKQYFINPSKNFIQNLEQLAGKENIKFVINHSKWKIK